MAPRILALLLALAVIPASAQAASKPSFPKTYKGTISGTYVADLDGGSTHKVTWTISKVRFRLEHVRFAEGRFWTGFYKVTGGTVTYTDTKTGTCTHDLSEKFALAPAMPKRVIATPFHMNRYVGSKDFYGGYIDPNKHWTVLESCTYSEDDFGAEEQRIDVRNMFDTGSKRGRIGSALKGKYVYKDDRPVSTTTYQWSLRPGR